DPLPARSEERLPDGQPEARLRRLVQGRRAGIRRAQRRRGEVVMTPLLAAEIPDFMLLPLKILALIGAAALGGLLLGWIAALITRPYFAQSIPPRMAWFIRALGAVACGMIAWWVLFHGGGSGIGGSGGWWPGGSGEGTKDASPKDDSKKEK